MPLESKATPESVAALAGLVEGKTISHGSGKQVLARLVAAGGDPAQIVESEGWRRSLTRASSTRS